nr:formyltransferase family protein [Lysinibacillus timonensis]
MRKKVALYLMTEKGRYSLKKILEKSYHVDYVVYSDYINNDESKSEEIKKLSELYNITCFERKNAPKIQEEYIIAIGWKWIINSDKVIVFHDSLLPKYRGFNPLPTALINGDKEIGVTAIIANENYDSGDIVAQKSIGINYPIKIYDAIEKIKVLYADMLEKIIELLGEYNSLPSYKQNNNEATYSLWRDDEDYKIDWTQSSEYIKRKIDAVGYPYDGAYTILNNKIYRIHDAEVVSDLPIINRTPGKIIFKEGEHPIIVCGSGLLKIYNLINEDSEDVISKIKFRSRFK